MIIATRIDILGRVTEPPTQLPVIRPEWLRPDASFLILRCVGDDSTAAFRALVDFMKRPRSSRAGTSWTIVSSGFGDIADILREDGRDADELNDLDALIYQKQSPPSWAVLESGYTETHYSLAVALRRRDLIAVHCDAVLRDAIQKWIDREPRPPLTRVPSDLS